MKVLHVADYYQDGTGHPLNNICENLKKRGHETIVYTSTLSTLPINHRDEESPIKIVRFNGLKLASKAFYPGVISKLLFQKNPDIVHSHVVGFFSTFVTGYLKIIKKYKLVVMADFDVAEPEPSLIKKPYIWLYRKIPAKMADVITTFTEKEKEEFSKRFGVDKEKIAVLPIGIDYEKFSSDPKKDLKRKFNLKDKFVILNVSYVTPKKNLEAIIKSVKLLNDARVVFIHIGNVSDPKYKSSLDALAKDLEVGDKILFLEDLPREEIYDYFKMADVFVQPGYRESYAIPVLEAMASGTPILATSSGISSEIIINGKNGFIIKDREDLVSRIELLLNNTGLRKKMGIEGKKTARRYDWNRVIDKLETIYGKLGAEK